LFVLRRLIEVGLVLIKSKDLRDQQEALERGESTDCFGEMCFAGGSEMEGNQCGRLSIHLLSVICHVTRRTLSQSLHYQ
jgi:hypothetical protein